MQEDGGSRIGRGGLARMDLEGMPGTTKRRTEDDVKGGRGGQGETGETRRDKANLRVGLVCAEPANS